MPVNVLFPAVTPVLELCKLFRTFIRIKYYCFILLIFTSPINVKLTFFQKIVYTFYFLLAKFLIFILCLFIYWVLGKTIFLSNKAFVLSSFLFHSIIFHWNSEKKKNLKVSVETRT